MEDVIIIGGGLAGLVSAITLSRSGLKVLVVEKKAYPFHRVCGEYISKEVLPFLIKLGIDPFAFGASNITKLQVTATSGKQLNLPLGLGGFGISRYLLDNQLYNIALQHGAAFELNMLATDIVFKNNYSTVTLGSGKEIDGRLVIGSFGKRSNLDRKLDRAFFKKKSPYMGIKYHIQIDYPEDLISLHLFKDGYCGISKIEDNKYCLCYLSHRDNLKGYESISEMEEKLLSKNPHLKQIFKDAVSLYDKPEVINEISFEKKTTVENHIVMAGDAVGMISPLCGNGMSMAIHSAKMLSEIIVKNWSSQGLNQHTIEDTYRQTWTSTFSRRLWLGRKIQNIFGNELLTSASISFLKTFKPAARYLIEQTHGQPIA